VDTVTPHPGLGVATGVAVLIRVRSIDTVHDLPTVSPVNTTGAPAADTIAVRVFSPRACTATGLPREQRTVSPDDVSASTATTSITGAIGAGMMSCAMIDEAIDTPDTGSPAAAAAGAPAIPTTAIVAMTILASHARVLVLHIAVSSSSGLIGLTPSRDSHGPPLRDLNVEPGTLFSPSTRVKRA
jgi:hypothetical protein